MTDEEKMPVPEPETPPQPDSALEPAAAPPTGPENSAPEQPDAGGDEQPDNPAPPADPLKVVEALLFAADEPVKLERLADLAMVSPETARAMIDELNNRYHDTGRTFRVHRVAQGFQLYTLPEYAEWVRRLYQHQYTHRLSRAALEVLAIIAYKQPVTRPEIEALRGVDCSGPIVTLLERRLTATFGRAARPGNPFLYRTTPEFLRYFGLVGLEDLPRMEDIGEFLARRQAEGGAADPAAEKFDSLAMDGGHEDAAPEQAR